MSEIVTVLAIYTTLSGQCVTQSVQAPVDQIDAAVRSVIPPGYGYRLIDEADLPTDAPVETWVDDMERITADMSRVAPPPIRVITARSFMRRLPDVTQLAITEAARTSAEVDLWLRKALAGSVELDHPETAAGIDSLIGVGLLTEADKVALLADGTSDEAP